jgi:hypothetical protein
MYLTKLFALNIVQFVYICSTLGLDLFSIMLFMMFAVYLETLTLSDGHGFPLIDWTCFVAQLFYIVFFAMGGVTWASIVFFFLFGQTVGSVYYREGGEPFRGTDVFFLGEILLGITFTPTLTFYGWWVVFLTGVFSAVGVLELDKDRRALDENIQARVF